MMSVLVIVGCGQAKIWKVEPSTGPTAAKFAYISNYFNLNKEYGKKFSDRWVILSAKYGFIDPDFIIEKDYNVTFKRKETNPISIEELRKQVDQKRLDGFDRVIVLGGRDYALIVREAFKNTNCRIIAPLEGFPIGLAMQKVRRAIDSETIFR